MENPDDSKKALQEVTERKRAEQPLKPEQNPDDDGVPWDEPAPIKAIVPPQLLKFREPTPEERAKWQAEEEDRQRRTAEAAKRQEYYRREGDWRAVERTMGPKHANKLLKDWEFFGDEESQRAQRENLDKLREHIRSMPGSLSAGTNLIWSGTKGTGKDHMMAATLRHAVWQHGCKAKWMLGANLFLSLRGTMVKGAKTTEQDLVKELCEVPILALSDPLPTVGGLTGYQADALLTITDERYRHQRPIFCTLNIADRADAEARLGALLVDRLFENSLILFSSWPSYRQHTQQRNSGAKPDDTSDGTKGG